MSEKCIGRGVDFKGQQLSEIMSQVIIIVSSVRTYERTLLTRDAAKRACGRFRPRSYHPSRCALLVFLRESLRMLTQSATNIACLLAQIVAFVVGYQKESFWVTFYGWSIGTTAAMLLCCPDWCWFSRNPVEWLAPFGKEKISPTPKAGGVVEANEAKPKPKPKPKPKQKKKEKENAQPDTKEE